MDIPGFSQMSLLRYSLPLIYMADTQQFSSFVQRLV